MINRFGYSILSTTFRKHVTSAITTNTRSLPLIRSPPVLGILGVRNCSSKSSTPPPDGNVAASRQKPELRDPNIRDPSKEVTVETSMRYMRSTGYKETYGGQRVWVLYRRNFKGQFAPKTREACFYKGKINTGNPCPICRDEFLVLDYRNTDLLKQFISPFNGETLGTEKTGLCQEKHFRLLAEIERAEDYGTLTFDIRFRVFDYSEYYPKEKLDKLKEHSQCNHS